MKQFDTWVQWIADRLIGALFYVDEAIADLGGDE